MNNDNGLCEALPTDDWSKHLRGAECWQSDTNAYNLKWVEPTTTAVERFFMRLRVVWTEVEKYDATHVHPLMARR